MLNKQAKEAFIKEYEKYYFPSDNINHEENSKDKEMPKKIKTTKPEIEDFFFYKDGKPTIVKPLTEGTVKYAVAWKAGKLEPELSSQGEPKIKSFEKNGFKIGQRGAFLNIQDLNAYFDYLNENKKKIINSYRCAVENSIDEIDFKNLGKMYETAIAKNEKTEYVPNGIGSVYVINLLFFLSSGEIPIYDQFAHKALVSLYVKEFSNGKELISPYDIFIGSAPDRKSVNMYAEYLRLLKKVFGYCNIERSLDRALWVYGHCSEAYSSI